ncbi:hypothetical protein OKW31_001692 [Paraburkholderia atlantica]
MVQRHMFDAPETKKPPEGGFRSLLIQTDSNPAYSPATLLRLALRRSCSFR